MLQKRREAVSAVAEKLSAFELAVDQAIIAGAALTSEFPQARLHANLSAVVGQEAFGLVAEAMANLNAVRSKTVAAHHEFAEVQDSLGIRERMGGMGWKSASATKRNLELVEAA
jgi:hypothetical protein